MTAHATGRTTLISVRPALPDTPPYEHRSRRSVDAAGEDRRSLCCSSGGRRGNHPTAAPTAVSGGGARAVGRGRSSAARQHQPPRHLAPPACTPAGGAESGAGPPDLSQGTRIRCNVDGIRCVMVAAGRPWPHQNAKPTGQEALDAAARCVVAWSRPGAPCCRTRRSGHGAAGSGRGSSPCDHAASAVASPTPRRGEEGCGGKEGEHGKGLAAAVLAAARTPGSTLERRRGLRSGWRRGFGGGAGESTVCVIHFSWA